MFQMATIISKHAHHSLLGYLTLFCLAIFFYNSGIYAHLDSCSAMGSPVCITCVQSTHVSYFMYVMWVAPIFWLVYSFACMPSLTYFDKQK